MTIVNKIAAFLMVGIILLVVIKRYIFDADKLSSNYRYTVATIYKISYPADGGPDADFHFCVNHVTYKNFTSFNSDKQKVSVGDKFLLKYYPPNPKIARVFLDKPMDSISISKMNITFCEDNK
ncbi:MAG: hypothetical protein J7502_09755 [Flavisolibacter sp.]|nr:hypothetical protein [Flavisolibacter sp.]